MSVLFRRPEVNHGYKKSRKDSRPLPQPKRKDDDLFVFGYACKLFKDDRRAEHMDQAKHLIPWPGDNNLLIDSHPWIYGKKLLVSIKKQISKDYKKKEVEYITAYDCSYDGRLLFTDQSQFITKTENYIPTPEEEEIERRCDEERYLELTTDLMEQDINQEEEMKRFKEALAQDGAYNAVAFGYDDISGKDGTGQPGECSSPVQGPARFGEENQEVGPVNKLSSWQPEPQVVEKFVAAEELEVPSDMEIPDTGKMNSIVEKTALFVSKQGAQMEILVKAKQAGNPQFDFLQFDNWLNPYYKHMLKFIKEGKYVPHLPSQASPEEEDKNSEDSDEDDSDDEYELHPLLTASLHRNTPCTPTSSLTSSPIPDAILGDNFRWTFAPAGSRDVAPHVPGSVEGFPGQSYNLMYSGGECEDRSMDDGQLDTWTQEYVGYPYEVPTSGYGLPVMMDPYAVTMAYMQSAVHTPPILSIADMIPPPPPPPGEGPPEEEWLNEGMHPEAPVVPLPPPPPPPPILPLFLCPEEPVVPSMIAGPAVLPGIPPVMQPTPSVTIIPPPPDLQPIVDKLANYVARNGLDFEGIIKAKRDPRFDFVHPWNEHHSYYLYKKQVCAEQVEQSAAVKAHKSADSTKEPSVANNPKATISFSIKPKDMQKPKIEYRSNVIYKQSFGQGESEEDEENIEAQEDEEKDNSSKEEDKDSEETKAIEEMLEAESQKLEDAETDLKQQMNAVEAAEREARRLEAESQSQVEKQLQLERRRKASLFISMLKKTTGPEDENQDERWDEQSSQELWNSKRTFSERKREQEDSEMDHARMKKGRYGEEALAASGVGAPPADSIRVTRDLMAKVLAASRTNR